VTHGTNILMPPKWKGYGVAALLSCVASVAVAQPLRTPLQQSVPTVSAGCVVLVHGLAGSGWNWVGMRQLLQRSGYHVVILDYPSRQQSIQMSAQALQPAIQQCVQTQHTPVHLVGHSMGGLLIRYYLQHYGATNIGRVVMLGTPNQGTELSDPTAQQPYERAVAGWLGPAVAQMTTDVDGFVARLPEPSVPTGIIAGYLTPVPWLNRRFNTANDGLVAVYSTRLSTMQDFVLIRSIHSSLPLNVDAQRQIGWFLATGRFYSPQ